MEKLDRCLGEGHVGILWTTTDGITHWIIVDKKNGDKYNVLDPWKGVLTYDEDKLRGLWNDKKFYFFEIINGV
jgi:ABC-type bacteriocin/lantibiotic exporter with double-glycine peptidase domain